MHFSAEWTKCEDHEILYISYEEIINGNIRYDPLFTFRVESGEITWMSCLTSFGRALDVSSSDDLAYARAFVKSVFNRHKAERGDNASLSR